MATTSKTKMRFVVAAGCAIVATVLLYFGVATAMLRQVACNNDYSIFHPNPHCRAPAILELAFFLALAATLLFAGLAIYSLRSERRKQVA